MGARTQRRPSSNSFALLLAAGLAGAAGCATSKVTVAPPPPVVLVYEFSVDEHDFVADTLGPRFAGRPSTVSERRERGRDVSRDLAQAIVASLRANAITAQTWSVSVQPALGALLVKGQFLATVERSRGGGATLGFGPLDSGLTVQAQTYRVTQDGLRRVREIESPSQAAAAMPPATVVPGGLTIASQTKGDLRADVKKVAQTYAQHVVRYYREQAWLAAPAVVPPAR